VESKKSTEAPEAEKRIDQITSATTTSVRRTRLRSKAKLGAAAAGGAAAAVGATALVASGSSLKGKKTKVDDGTPKIVCYYTNWSQYRVKIGKFVPEDIPADLCTHIIFAFGWLKKNKLSSYESNDETKDNVPGLYERMMGLKKANPKLKVGYIVILEYYDFLIAFPNSFRSFLLWEAGPSAPRSSRTCQPRDTPARPLSTRPFPSCANVASMVSTWIGNTPRVPMTRRTSSCC